MIKGKRFDYGFEPGRNGHNAAGATEYRLSIPHRYSNILSRNGYDTCEQDDLLCPRVRLKRDLATIS
jgi:hypothetical protein